MREWLEDWLEDSLADDGIRDDSEFYDYIGHMRLVSANLSNIQVTLKNESSFLKHSVDETLDIAETIQKLRFDYFNLLVSSDSVVEINATINGKNHLNDIYKLDEQIIKFTTETEKLINDNNKFKAANTLNELKVALKRAQSIDSFILGRAERKIDEFGEEIESADDEDIDYELLANPPILKQHNVYNTYPHPSMGVPQPPYQNDTRPHTAYNFSAHNTPNNYENNPLSQNNVSTSVEEQYGILRNQVPVRIEHHRYNENFYPPEVPPQMKQCGNNRQPVRERKRTIDRKKVGALVLAASLCVGGLTLYNSNKNKDVNIPNVPTQPAYTEMTPTPEVTPTPKISIQAEVSKTTTSPTLSTETYATANTQVATPTSTPQKYAEGTLAYTVQFLDDEMISVVANSLRNSMNGRNGNQIAGYANGVNQTFDNDREYVEYVFNTLDSRAKTMRYSDNCNRFGIAPQMEQLSGDVSKYLIVKALNESGKYKRTDYTADDIDFYWTIYGGKTNAFDVRTVKIENGILVVDQLIGHTCHFSGDMGKLISSHCALESAVEGTGPAYKDKLTGGLTHCAFGTQEGTVILDESLKAYDALVNIFEHEYELKVNAPGKGVKIQYENEYDR